MAGETQIYRVETIYDVTDRASKSLGEIEKSSRAAARSSESLKTMLLSLGAMNIGARIFGVAKQHLIGYNSELENSQTVIAGMLSLYTGASMERTWDRAAVSVQRFQQMAAHSALTTKELVDTAQGITRPLIQAGVHMGDIEKLTFGTANAAKAFGMSGSVVAMDIEQAIRGGVGVRDRFMKSMLSQKGVDLSGDQFNKLSQEKRIEALKKALTSPAISAMAEKQSQTMSGVMSTLEDNIQIALGKVGLPLFKAITEEVKGWNAWIEKNSGRIEEIGKSVGQGFLTAFKTIKEVGAALFPILKELMGVIVSAMRFAAEHKDTLIGLAKGMLVMKIGQTVGRMGMGLVGDTKGLFASTFGKEGIGGIIESMKGLKSGTTDMVGMFGKLASNLPGVIGGLAKLGLAAYAIGSLLLQKTEGEKKQMAQAAARHLTAVQLKMARAEVGELTTELGSFTSGVDPLKAQFASPALKAQQEQLRQRRADLEKTEIEAIKQGKEEGWITTEAGEGGKRVVRMNASMGRSITYEGGSKAAKELMAKNEELLKQLGEIFASHGTFNKNTMKGEFKEAIIEAQAETADEFDKNAQANAPKQTVNINIQQVSAKDPNRWLADMDDMVARRTRAPTRAKRAPKASPQ